MELVRERRLRSTLRAVAAAHPFYRKRFQELRICADTIQTLNDLEQLPVTTKVDFIADPDAFRLRADDLPADFSIPERVLWDVAYTTGTTTDGRPSPFYNTTHDAYTIFDHARRCNETEGLRDGDRIGNLYPLADFPTGAFLSVVRSTMIAGIPVVHGLTGTANSEFKVRNSLHDAIRKVQALKPTVLWGVPSFVRRFLHEATALKADFSAVRLILTSGEPVSAVLKQELRDRLQRMGAGPVEFRVRYAFTEMQGGFVQCAEDAAPQNSGPDLYFFEVVDQQTGRRLPDGESGMLALTHLHRRGTVLLRYLVGDIVRISREPCPMCGRQGERIMGTPRRVGSLVKCRGMLINTDVIVDLLSATQDIGEFQIVFKGGESLEAMDRLVVRIEIDEPTGAAAALLRAEVTRRIREAVSLKPEIDFAARGSLYGDGKSIKAKRIVDLRPAAS